MKTLKFDPIEYLLLLLITFVVTVKIVSCQGKTDPLESATFPCTCTWENTRLWEVKFDCQDKNYYFRSKLYSDSCDEKTILYKPLNK